MNGKQLIDIGVRLKANNYADYIDPLARAVEDVQALYDYVSILEDQLGDARLEIEMLERNEDYRTIYRKDMSTLERENNRMRDLLDAIGLDMDRRYSVADLLAFSVRVGGER